ncbi:MAG: hypothetical protein A3E84_00570 [Gammaproteobacteria bacterium RIFCSPHIGHO2_12_FULL_42_13]|nr:MAG: hypothetical protein A3E84_00570 [Gammaproteobacteria bacterium RIFCSPHIGHO2_12_FULL_42_13]
MRLKLLFISCCIVLVTACAEKRLAPVINAWHQPGAASRYYVVREGDTIYSIAFAFELDYRDIVLLNRLAPPYTVRVGERLAMPTKRASGEKLPVSNPTHFAKTPIETGQSSLATPIFHLPAKGRVIRNFSNSYNGNRGIEIHGHLGQPVRAAAGGQVVYSGAGIRGYGNLIIIKHGPHYLTAYAFNQRNRVHSGDFVSAGHVIAYMGHNAQGRAMLYFEIRRNGVPVNPMRLGPS